MNKRILNIEVFQKENAFEDFYKQKGCKKEFDTLVINDKDFSTYKSKQEFDKLIYQLEFYKRNYEILLDKIVNKG